MDKTIIENGFFILRFVNEDQNLVEFYESVSQEFIQFHFCHKGSGSLEFNDGNYQLPLISKSVNLLYNPLRALPINLKISPNSYFSKSCDFNKKVS